MLEFLILSVKTLTTVYIVVAAVFFLFSLFAELLVPGNFQYKNKTFSTFEQLVMSALLASLWIFFLPSFIKGLTSGNGRQ